MRIYRPTYRYHICPFEIAIIEIRGGLLDPPPHPLRALCHKQWPRASRINRNYLTNKKIRFGTVGISTVDNYASDLIQLIHKSML